ncbi:BrnT family toxin [Falsiroseomonas sp. E2-1-a20]|uniref:BrnT family toxin n=1 Tax=Falsiroseomonas sp. E2-1-a20 TaxID=3239300 RepID=UPI003F357373
MATYEWDENKRNTNLLRHKLDFIDCDLIFEGDHCVVEAAPGSDQARFIAIGSIHGRYCAVIYTPRGDAIRII